MTKQRRVGAHPINRTAPFARNSAVKPPYNFVPLDDDKQFHPLMRRTQNRWIAPAQTPQSLPIHTEFLGSLDDVAEVLAQSTSGSLVAKMRKRFWPPRKHRHQRLTRLGQLGLQSGPGPLRRLEIRLFAGIDNGGALLSRRSHLSRTKLSLTQPRLQPLATLHRSPQYRLEAQRHRTLQHSAKLRDTMFRSLSRAHRLAMAPHAATDATARAEHRPLEQA
jgi:hypothetical protein